MVNHKQIQMHWPHKPQQSRIDEFVFLSQNPVTQIQLVLENTWNLFTGGRFIWSSLLTLNFVFISFEFKVLFLISALFESNSFCGSKIIQNM